MSRYFITAVGGLRTIVIADGDGKSDDIEPEDLGQEELEPIERHLTFGVDSLTVVLPIGVDGLCGLPQLLRMLTMHLYEVVGGDLLPIQDQSKQTAHGITHPINRGSVENRHHGRRFHLISCCPQVLNAVAI